MTKAQAATLRWFKWESLKHPELCDYAFFVYLDDVRDDYGWPIPTTSDARTAAENKAVGGSPTSRHLAGQAVDIPFPPSENHLWWLVSAILKCQRSFPIELIVYPSKSHVHIAWDKVGKASSFIIASE